MLLRLSVALATLLLAAPFAFSQIIQTIPIEPETDWHKIGFWESVDGQPVDQSWEFTDGEVRLVNPRGGRGSLLSPPLPSHFELSWQWKIEKKTNNGLKYRVRKFDRGWLGIEYQIIDELPGKGKGKGSTASLYDLVAPLEDIPLKPAGQWNDARVIAIGSRLEHYLNGVLVASTDTTQPAWDLQIALSKFYGVQQFGLPGPEDRIMLTDHGGRASYRSFDFKPKDPPKPKTMARMAPYLGNALRNNWVDQDSAVIWTRTTKSPEMVKQGPKFNKIGRDEVARLSQTRDAKSILDAQLPPNHKLEEMTGALAGAEGQVRLSYFPKMQRGAITRTAWKTTTVDDDYTMRWKIDGLKPGKEYAAVVEARTKEGVLTAVTRGAFTTPPRPDQSKEVSFCVTTCHDFFRRDDDWNGHKIYPSMLKLRPDFVVHAGDIEYYDKPDPWAMTIELMRFKWARIFALPSNRNFYRQTTSYFLKDDHDTLKNDCWAGQRYGAVTFEQGQELFNQEQFPTLERRYKTVRWGRDLQVWFLEGRDFRSPNTMPDGPEKTILGNQQKDWLFSTLAVSESKFKLILSPTPIVGPDRGNKRDNHANDVFVHEGNQIRRELARHEHVIVLCGDRHWQYASVDEETNLWEFGCGPGSEKHGLGWKKGDERPVHRFLRVAGGFLSGQLTYQKGEARLTLRHHKVTGEPVSEFEFPEQAK